MVALGALMLHAVIASKGNGECGIGGYFLQFSMRSWYLAYSDLESRAKQMAIGIVLLSDARPLIC